MIKSFDIEYLRVNNDFNHPSVAVLKDGRQIACGNAKNYADAVSAANSRFKKA